jgi:anti-anti-sigma factor
VKIEVSERNNYFLARLNGVLDEEAQAPFDEKLHPLVAEGERRIVLDLAGVPRATSAGIGHLVTLVARVNTKQGRIVLASPTPFVSTVFSATRLSKYFDIEDDIESAATRLLKE